MVFSGIRREDERERGSEDASLARAPVCVYRDGGLSSLFSTVWVTPDEVVKWSVGEADVRG